MIHSGGKEDRIVRVFSSLLVPVSLVLILGGIIVTGCGVLLEVITHEPVYLAMIVAGSCAIAGGVICHCLKRN